MSRRVAANAILNLVGIGLPMLSGLLAVPLLLHGLGADKLGVFSLAMGVFGFSGLFDLGLGRALTQTVAMESGRGTRLPALAYLVRRGLAAVALLGFAWGCALALFAPALVHDVFHLHAALAEETRNGLIWLGLSLPFSLLGGGCIGVLEGLQKFKLITILRIPLNSAVFLVPALVAQISNDLGLVLAGLALTRVVAFGIWVWMLGRNFPLWQFGAAGELPSTAHMWRFTGWLGVSNLVGPFMVHADRYYLANIFPPAVVAFYTVPLDAMFRGTSLPVAAMNAVFPALAHQGVHAADSRRLIKGAAWLLLVFWSLPILLVAVWLPQLLELWLGGTFAQHIVLIAQWLLVGVLVNGFAHLPYALLQAEGRSDITAKIHLVELPIYAVMLVLLVGWYGITGVAVAWFLRVVLDAVLLFLLSVRVLRVPLFVFKTAILFMGGAILAALMLYLPANMLAKAICSMMLGSALLVGSLVFMRYLNRKEKVELL